jgi:hypothetical protein
MVLDSQATAGGEKGVGKVEVQTFNPVFFLGRSVPCEVRSVHTVFRRQEGEVPKIIEGLRGGNDPRRVKD